MEDHAGEGAGAPRGACLTACFQDGLQDWAWLTGCLLDAVLRRVRLNCSLLDGVPSWAWLTCCFGQLGVADRSSHGWVRSGAPWKREARTIGATSRPGAQMPIGAWDHRFHGEGERQ